MKNRVVGPYLNFFMNKEVISEHVLQTVLKEKIIMEINQLAISRRFRLICLHQTLRNQSPWAICVRRWSVIRLALFLKKSVIRPIRINHLGDWGLNLGNWSSPIKKWGSEEAVKKEPINELLRLYVEFHEQAENDKALEDEARAWFKKLEDGDQEATELWQWFRDESLQEFQQKYMTCWK